MTFLGRILCQIGCLREADVLLVLAEQRRRRVRFGRCARRLDLISDDQLSLALGIQSMDDQLIRSLDDVQIDPATLRHIAEEVARKCEILPLFTRSHTLVVAMADPFQNPYLLSLTPEARGDIGFIVVHREDLLKAIDLHYRGIPVRYA